MVLRALTQARAYAPPSTAASVCRGSRRGLRYIGFKRPRSLWGTRLGATGVGLALGLGGLFWYVNREEVIFTRRRRLKIPLDPRDDVEAGRQMLQMVLDVDRSFKASNDEAEQEIQALVESRFARLQKEVDVLRLPYLDWEVHVVRKRELNAFCLPGGKMVVYTGLLEFFGDLYEKKQLSVHPVQALDCVLAHEMAHAICRHNVEGQTGLYSLLLPLCVALSVKSPLLISLSTYLLELPYSRLLEEEADAVAMILMFRSCLDGGVLPEVVGKLAEGGWSSLGPVLTWMSTHPQGEYRAGLARSKVEELRRKNLPKECMIETMADLPSTLVDVESARVVGDVQAETQGASVQLDHGGRMVNDAGEDEGLPAYWKEVWRGWATIVGFLEGRGEGKRAEADAQRSGAGR